MEENVLIHGPVRRCPGLVLPIYPYLGEEHESLRVGRREVVVGGLSGVCMGFINLCLQAGRQAGKPRLLLFVVTPNRTSQSIFPIARET